MNTTNTGTLRFTSAKSFPAIAGRGNERPGTDGRRLGIAFLVPEDRQTGTYFRYHNLAAALRQLGHQVTVYSQSSENRIRKSIEFRDGVPYVLSATAPGNRWILPPTNPVTCFRRLFGHIATADVYHLFQPFPSAAIPWLWLKQRRSGVFAYDWDDFWINDEFGLKHPRGLQASWAAFCVRRLEKSLPASSHLTTTVSHALAGLARERKAPRAEVVYNGIWPRSPVPKETARAALGLVQEAFYVGLMGWSGEIGWCLEAIRQHAARFPNLRLAMTGRDPGAILRKYPDIASRVDYLGSLSERKFDFFNSALDLGLVPMRDSDFNHYRLPYKLTDHLAGGTPILCSRIGEAARIGPELEGIFFCQPTLDSWLSGFRDAVTQLSNSRGMPPLSSTPLLKRFSWLKIARQTSDAYLSALVSRQSLMP